MEGPMKNLFDPAGKVALVTGGTSGLGHAIAEAFLQNGVDVAVCSRHPESAPELAELAAAEGRRYLPVYCDITKEEDVEKMGDIIEKELGPVTMLVNSVRWSESIAMAMESKGFCGEAPRTYYTVPRVHWYDLAAAALMVGGVVLGMLFLKL